MTTWRVAHSPKQLICMYRLMRRPVIWSISPDGEILRKEHSRSHLATLLALWRYWRAPLEF